MADGKNLSVEEILAACRASDGGDASANPPGAEAKAESTPAVEPTVPASESATGPKEVAEKPAAASPAAAATSPAATGKKAAEMSVADILAAARGEQSGKAATTKDKGAAKKSAKAEVSKQAAPSKGKPTPAKTSPKSPAKAATQVPKDTMSILAAARNAQKPGPMSKSEAAAKVIEKSPASKGKPKVFAPPMPEKPAYTVGRTATSDPAFADRRGFIASSLAAFFGSFLAIGFTSLGLTHLLWLLGCARFMFPNISIEPPSSFRVGFPDEYAPGQVEAKYKAQFGIWVVRFEYEGQPQIYALKSVCTHLGCTPNWLEGEQKFKCPCHGSGFYKDGINFEGPAPRPLERYGISLAADGKLMVDKSKLFNEEKGQWKDAASYVPV